MSSSKHPEVCGSRGPRIGGSGQPRCAKTLGHDGPHQGFPGSGFESQGWGTPLMRDLDFAESYGWPVDAPVVGPWTLDLGLLDARTLGLQA